MSIVTDDYEGYLKTSATGLTLQTPYNPGLETSTPIWLTTHSAPKKKMKKKKKSKKKKYKKKNKKVKKKKKKKGK